MHTIDARRSVLVLVDYQTRLMPAMADQIGVQANAVRLARMAGLLKYQGSLLGYFYYQKPVISEGPPYGFAWGTADELFGRHFILLKDVPVQDSVPVFAGRERWQEWRRTSFKD